MILKSLARKEPTFGQLVAYFLNPKEAEIAITQNFRVGTEAPTVIVQQFKENYELLPKRKNGNALYHEIIALPPDSKGSKREQVAALKEIAEKYLASRAELHLAFGVIHRDTDCLHMHLLISSNALLSHRRARLTKAAFATIQRETEEYQIAHYPKLGSQRYYAAGSREAETAQQHIAVTPKSTKRQRTKATTREQAAALRTGRPSKKEQLAQTIQTALTTAAKPHELTAVLAAAGLTLYRRGKSVGVQTEGGRRYRLTTLGIARNYAEATARWDLAESRLAELSRGKQQMREREWEP